MSKAGALSASRARRRAAPTTSAPQARRPAFPERYDGEQHTTSFSIVDKFGNAIGVTPTLGGLFGNNVVVGTTGLLLNNGMRLGSTSPYPDRRELRRRRQDSDPQQLAGRRVEGRQAGVRVRHARRRDDRPDRVPGAGQPDRLQAAGAAGDRSAALRRSTPSRTSTSRAPRSGVDREPRAAGDASTR